MIVVDHHDDVARCIDLIQLVLAVPRRPNCGLLTSQILANFHGIVPLIHNSHSMGGVPLPRGDARNYASISKVLRMSHRTLLRGHAYRFLYPRHNFEGVRSGLEERRILVEQVRDTSTDPLDEETLISNPLLKRGRWLVTGIDLDKDEERSFYVESMIAVMEIRSRRPTMDESQRNEVSLMESAV